MSILLESGYCDCACRDCFDIAIHDEGETDALCNGCEDAGCEAHAGECNQPSEEQDIDDHNFGNASW